ncbi:MAG: HDOD domain-containing protein [Syntrophobacterales bacterium]|nr:HDOD domain-containing protein [Syntrophobacterales bacterium]
MLEKIIQSVDSIPAFPLVVHKIMLLITREDYVVTDLVKLIEYDQSITANILKMSNSAYFGSRHKIKTIHDAVVYLGQQNLIHIVQTAGASRFYRKVSGGYVSHAHDLWKHSVAVAIMSQVLAQKVLQRVDPTLYAAALLHDIGKVFLGEYVRDSLPKIEELVEQNGYSFLEGEKEILGIDHAELGGMIALHWNFPEETREGIAYHHQPRSLGSKESLIPWLVYLSDQLCMMVGVDGGVDGLAYRGLEESLTRFNLRGKDLEKSIITFHDLLLEAEDVLNIV